MEKVLISQLTWEQKSALKKQTSDEWKIFIDSKMNEKDIRFLYVNESFMQFLRELYFTSGEWSDNPWETKNPAFDLSLHHDDYGVIFIHGHKGKDFHVDTVGLLEVSFNQIEENLFQPLLEEFEFYDFIMKEEVGRWSKPGEEKVFDLTTDGFSEK